MYKHHTQKEMVPEESSMNNTGNTLEAEAAILRKIDDEVKKMSPEIRAEAFQILVQRHLHGNTSAVPSPSISPKPAAKKTHRAKSGSELAVIRDLNLKGEKDLPSLRDFYSQKAPSSFVEHNT